MNSLDNILETENLNNKELLKHHYFPNIMLEQTAVAADFKVDNGFQRIFFGDPQNSQSNVSLNNLSSEESDCLENEIIKIKQEGYGEGFIEGKKKGKESEKKVAAVIINELREAITELEKFKVSICRKAEKSAVKLAFSIAEKILCAEIEKNKDFIINIVTQALKKVMGDETIRIKINPADLSYIKEAAVLQNDAALACQRIDFISDVRISRGGCIVETDSGEIDARIESQLKVIEDTFAENIIR